jgi:DNA-binding transcriptional ArsR family regulator
MRNDKPAAGSDADADADVTVIFGALADPARLRIVQLLGGEPRRPGELAAALGVSAPAMSRHLRVLLAAGIVTDERRADDARLRYFRLQPQPMIAVQAWLDQLQANWTEQLASCPPPRRDHRVGHPPAWLPGLRGSRPGGQQVDLRAGQASQVSCH